MKLKPLLLTGIALGSLLFATHSALAQVTNFVSTSDEASLNYALSNSAVVLLEFNGTIGITGTKVISSDTILDGTGHNVTISGSGSLGVFYVNSGVHFTLKNLTIVNGLANGGGGAIYNNSGFVNVVNCTFSNNIAVGNNAIAAGYAATNSGAGGAICNVGTLIVSGSTFFNNGVNGGAGSTGAQGASPYSSGATGGIGGNGFGGAIYNCGGAFITNCTFFQNQAYGGQGGNGGRGYDGYSYSYVCGSYSCGFFSTCYYYCTGYNYYGGPGGYGGQGGDGYGGNIYNDSGHPFLLVNVTCAAGGANGGSGGSGGSPGSYNNSYNYSLGSGASGAGAGGNLGYYNSFFANLSLNKNTIVANATSGGNYWKGGAGGDVSDDGNNLSSDTTTPFYSITSYTNTNPNLVPLTTNGGPTMTMALLPDSPAIDKGQSIAGLATDQRGLPRSSGGGFDIGAYELQVVGIDAGLRVYDGTAIVKLACEGPGGTNSPVRFSKNGTNYGILLTATNSANASKLRIQTSSGAKAFLKLP